MLASDPSSVPLPSTPLGLRASHGLALSLSRLASKGVLVRPLSDRFCGLTLRLCERFGRWLAEQAAAREREAKKAAAGGGEREEEAADFSSPSSAAAPSVEALCAAACDAAAVADWMRAGEFARAMRESVGGGGREGNDASAASAAAAVTAAVGRAAAKLDASAASALSVAGTALGLAAAPKLQQQLRGVVATYRMTTRPPPTRPSPYAAAALAEARTAVSELQRKKTFSSSSSAGENAQTHSSLLAAAAVSAVAGAFADTAADVLDAVRRTESSLRRLKNKAGPEAAAVAGEGAAPAAPPSGSPEMTDADKIAAQILLDVAAFGKAGKELGCGDLGALAEFRRLWEVAAAGAAAGGGGGEGDCDVERVLVEAAARQQEQQQQAAVAQSPPPPPPRAASAAPAAAPPSMGPP